MRILVMGAGRMGSVRAEDLATDPRVTQVLVTNRSPGRAEALAARLTGTATATVGAVPWDRVTGLSREVDGVAVALATQFHAEALDLVLPWGLPALCEKPIATTLAGSRRLVDLAAAHGSALQVGFQRRFDPGLHALQQRAVAGGLGTLYAVRLLSHDHEPGRPEFIASSGGIFRDLHVHDLDLVAWLTGSPVQVVHATLAVREHRQYDVRHPGPTGPVPDGDVSLLHVRTASGVQASVHGARHDPRGYDVRVEMFGSQDSVAAGLTRRTPLLTVDGDGLLGDDVGAPYGGFVDRFRTAFRAETVAFVDLVGGGPNRCPPQAALDALRAAVACEVSVQRGVPVAVAEIDDTGC